MDSFEMGPNKKKTKKNAESVHFNHDYYHHHHYYYYYYYYYSPVACY